MGYQKEKKKAGSLAWHGSSQSNIDKSVSKLNYEGVIQAISAMVSYNHDASSSKKRVEVIHPVVPPSETVVPSNRCVSSKS